MTHTRLPRARYVNILRCSIIARAVIQRIVVMFVVFMSLNVAPAVYTETLLSAPAGLLPEGKQQIVDMAMNASGIRDTARVLHVSPTTILNELKKRRLTSNR